MTSWFMAGRLCTIRNFNRLSMSHERMDRGSMHDDVLLRGDDESSVPSFSRYRVAVKFGAHFSQSGKNFDGWYAKFYWVMTCFVY